MPDPRLVTDLGGLTLGRAGLAPAGRHTRVSDSVLAYTILPLTSLYRSHWILYFFHPYSTHSIAMIDPSQVQELAAKAPPVVVDVGASRGIHPRWEALLPHITVVGFEPDTRSFSQLQQTDEVRYLNTALFRDRGPKTFHLCRKPTNSSVYPPNREWLAQFPDPERFDVLETVTVNCVTLEEALASIDIAQMDFIKLDTQGSELDILEGAGDYLDGCIGVEVEVQFSPIYSGAALFHDVGAILWRKGFELFDLRRIFWSRVGGLPAGQKKGQLAYGDALFFRPPGWASSQEQCLRQTTLFLAYSYADAALQCAEADESLRRLLEQLSADDSGQPSKSLLTSLLGRWVGNQPKPPAKFKDGALGGIPN